MSVGRMTTRNPGWIGRWPGLLVAAIAVVLFLGAAPPAAAQAWRQKLKPYKSRFYDVRTDLTGDNLREAMLRADLMVREYAGRTRGFARQLNERLQLFLFTDPNDYYAAGGVRGSAGVYVMEGDGDKKLMVIAGPKLDDNVWSTLQHEGFHQFVQAVMGKGIPMWANEGLAEYFGEGVFTGDGFITGVIPPQRLRMLKLLLSEKKTRPLRDMMLTGRDQWNAALSAVNYVQAWSMVHFLAHARPEYEQAFNEFMRDVSKGVGWETSWKNRFGVDVDAFERRWREYWEAMPLDASLDLYSRAIVLTMTSFYGRAFAQQQRFATADEFFAAARAGKLKSNPDDWLPPALLQRDLPLVERIGAWTIDPRRPRQVVCEQLGGAKLTGQFDLSSGGRIRPESVQVTPTPAKKN